MRIVIDTNIWVSGLLSEGDGWRLLDLAEEGDVEICIAYPMLLELEEVLAYPTLPPFPS
ncbi:MAG: putative toxin-antitoxin system toxin component, PIN family [Armatimonadetes bacterium]|nr:putative toxin-antitoxin system toxin component, PIN family [Armatimonadota bacterium]